jgi:hypothetical protein
VIDRESTVGSITITDGDFFIFCPTGIGPDDASGLRSLSGVGNITIPCGAFVFETGTGPAVGAGTASTQGILRVGAIRISDGSIESEVWRRSAAVGSGCAVEGQSTVDHIIIETGEFLINGFGEGCTGVGSGRARDAAVPSVSHVGDVTIRKGRFTINGMNTAAIGSGYASRGTSSCGPITIEVGTFNICAGDEWAGVASGRAVYGNSTVGNINIKTGSFDVHGNRGGAIGSGYAFDGTSSVGDVAIASGPFRFSSFQSTALSSGYADDYGVSSVSSIRIERETFNIAPYSAEPATGGSIGPSYSYQDKSTGGAVAIRQGQSQIRAGDGGAGIGSSLAGEGTSSVSSITINGGNFTINCLSGAARRSEAIHRRGDRDLSGHICAGGRGSRSGDQDRVAPIWELHGEDLHISGRHFTRVRTAGDGAGIGTAHTYHGNAMLTALIIGCSPLFDSVHSRVNAARIGGGYSDHGNAPVGTLTIAGAAIREVVGGGRPPAIGAGHALGGTANVDHVTITRASIVATGGRESVRAIGSGTGLGRGTANVLESRMGPSRPASAVFLLGSGVLLLNCQSEAVSCIEGKKVRPAREFPARREVCEGKRKRQLWPDPRRTFPAPARMHGQLLSGRGLGHHAVVRL